MQDWTEEDGIHRATWTDSMAFLTGKKPLPIAPRFMEGPMVFSIGIPQVGDASADEQGNQDEPGMGKQESHDSLGQFIHDLLGLFVGHGEQANPCQEKFFRAVCAFQIRIVRLLVPWIPEEISATTMLSDFSARLSASSFTALWISETFAITLPLQGKSLTPGFPARRACR